MRGNQKTRERVLLIIPCYNEAGNIGRLMDEIDTIGEEYDKIVIDDGSTDDTYLIASRHTTCLKLAANLGIGGAVQTGIRYAWENGYDFCVQVDGDGQHPPDQIGLLFDTYRKSPANLIIGSRFLTSVDFRSTAARRFGIRIIGFFIKLLYQRKITDPTSGFRLMDKEAIRLFQKEYPIDFPEPISIGVALKNGLSVGETPVTMRAREHGSSSIIGHKTLSYMLRVVGYLILYRIGGHF